MLLQGHEQDSFLVRISDSFAGYIVSQIGPDKTCCHSFINIIKPMECGDDRGERLYHLQGQKAFFPSLPKLVEHYKVRRVAKDPVG